MYEVKVPVEVIKTVAFYFSQCSYDTYAITRDQIAPVDNSAGVANKRQLAGVHRRRTSKSSQATALRTGTKTEIMCLRYFDGIRQQDSPSKCTEGRGSAGVRYTSSPCE